MRRRPVATGFYSGDCAAQVDGFLAGFTPPAELANAVAGVVPHAGWGYSGAVAAKVIRTLANSGPETFVLFGAVHSWGAQSGGVFDEGSWITPLGEVPVDEELARRLIAACPGYLASSPESHGDEHSIEVQVPIIRHLCPAARIVPIAMPPSRKAAGAGTAVGKALAESGRRVAVLGSSDLTHYGRNYGFAPWGFGADAYRRMRENDHALVDLVLGFKAEEVVRKAEETSSACGSGAIAAAVAAALAMGATKSALVEYTTSHDVTGERPESFEMAVGYAGIVFGT